MATTTTPNMGMVLPVPLSEPGPGWATELIAALTAKVDLHDHTAGKGVTLQSSSLTINADLTFGGFNGIGFRSTRYNSQASNLVLGTDLGCISNVNGNLTWNNNAGTAVQITNGAAVNSASALTGPVVGTSRTVTTTYTVDSISGDYYLNVDTSGGGFVLTLPTPTVGRTLVLSDVKNNFGTAAVTLAPHGVEKINTVAANKVLSATGGIYLIQSNGTDWFMAGS
jgi:hypothetical protein